MTTKNGLICLSIAAIVVLCALNVATASTSYHSTTFYHSTRHTGDYMPMAKGNSNVISNRNCVTKGILTSSASSNGIVYIGSQDGNVYALNANTGTKIWNYTTGNWVRSSPTVANGIVYVGSWDHNIYALNATTGTKIWNYTTGNWVLSSPTVVNGIG